MILFLNVVVISLLSVAQALQLLILIAAIFSFIPIHTAPFVQQLFPVYLPEVRPEREMMFYRLVVVLAVGIQAMLIAINRHRLDQEVLYRRYLSYLANVFFWLTIELTAVFKIFVFGNPWWARVLLYLALALNAAALIFWPEFKKCLHQLWHWAQGRQQPRFVLGGQIFFGLALAVFLWPDMGKVMARLFVHDQFYHLDSFLMAPGWAALKGLALNTDVTSEYSVVAPVILSRTLSFLGGFNYEAALMLLIMIVFAYYAALYAFIRRWLGSVLLAVIAVVLTIKWQLFHWGVAPLVWQYPSATPLRFWPDIAVFFMLQRHIGTGRCSWLWAAALLNGFLLAWMIDAGVYLSAGLIVYLLLDGYVQGMAWIKNVGRAMKMMGVACVTAFGLIVLCSSGGALSMTFWRHDVEFAALFLKGWGALPMTDGLKDKQFLAFIMGFAIPVMYVLAGISVGAMLVMRLIDRKHIFIVFLSVYGLSLYHYFINRSAVTSYDVVIIPLVLILIFGLDKTLNLLTAGPRRLVLVVLAFFSVLALGTSYFFTAYPNHFNLAGINWPQEENYFQQNFDFKEDAALIQRFTAPNQRVAVLSSFETRILMQADRMPFFYYFPMIESSLMQDQKVRGTYLHTKQRLEATLAQLNTAAPAYVFVEQKLMGKTDQTGLTALIAYITANYTPIQTGRYLIAFKRH